MSFLFTYFNKFEFQVSIFAHAHSKISFASNYNKLQCKVLRFLVRKMCNSDYLIKKSINFKIN